MKKDRKKEYAGYSIAELKTLETRFSIMAAKGWMIDKINLFSYEYKRIEPAELKFFVDILPRVTAFDYPENNDVQEYRRICIESGWTFAASSKQLQIFYADTKDELLVPIHTDNVIEAKIMLKTCLKYELPYMLIAQFYFWIMCSNIIGEGWDMFLSNIYMAQAVGLVIFMPSYLWYLGSMLSWYVINTIRLKKDLPLTKTNYKITRIRGGYMKISGAMFLVLMLVGVVTTILGGAPMIIILFIAPTFIGLAVGLRIRRSIDKKDRGRAANKMLFAAALTVTVIVTIGVMAVGINILGRSTSDNESLPDDRMAVTLADAGVNVQPEHYSYFSVDSIAVPLNYTYYETIRGGGVRTEVKKTISKRLAKELYKNMLDDLNKREWLEVTQMSRSEAEAWGAAAGYFINSSKTQVLLLYEKAVLSIDYGLENADMKAITEKAKEIARQ